MNETDREYYIEFLTMVGNYSRTFYEKMRPELLELEYIQVLEERSE